MKNDLGIVFENMKRRFFGEKSYGEAGFFYNDRDFIQELKSCINVIEKRIEEIDTTIRHKEVLMSNLQFLKDSLKEIKKPKEIIMRCFILIGEILGFSGLLGKPIYDLFYYQDIHSYLIEEGFHNDFSKLEKHNKNIIILQKEAYTFLKKKNLSDHIISRVLNISGKRIKEIKRP